MAIAIALSAGALSAQTLEVTLTATDHNGYHISCFGVKDGAIDATVSGGTAPYTYAWSNNATTEDLSGLATGYYRLVVTDAASATEEAEITLTEPLALRVGVDPFTYPSGMNVSCNECFNGSIDITVADGVPPYDHLWDDGPNTADRSGLGALAYQVTATDANGCTITSERISLTQPERDDWSKQGNAGTNPSQHYFGTSDAKDVVFKSNGQERLRLLSGGDVKLTSPLLHAGVVYIDADGVLRGGGFPPNKPPLPPGVPCYNIDQFPPFWETRGNDFDELCPEDIPILGTLSDHNLYFFTAGDERMVINTHGKVGIGTAPSAGPVNGYRLFVADGIATNDVLVKLGAWPDYVFDEGYGLMPLSELRAFLQRHSHLPHVPAAKELEAKGGVPLGDLAHQLTRTVEEQALYILQLEERLASMECELRQLAATHGQRLSTLETSK